jgi:hypothetical protein
MLSTDDDIDELLGAEVYLGVDGHTEEDGRLTVSAVAMNRQRRYAAVQCGGTAGLLHWLARPAREQHVTLLGIAVDLTRAGGVVARDLEAAGHPVTGYQVAEMAVASHAFYVDMADRRFRRAEAHWRNDALDDAVAKARCKPLGDDTAERFVFTTYAKSIDLSPLIALVLANYLASGPTPAPFATWGPNPFSDDPGPDIQQRGGYRFPTFTTHDGDR